VSGVSHFEVCNEQHSCEYYMLESNLLHKLHTRTEKERSQQDRAEVSLEERLETKSLLKHKYA